ncbi:CCN family member 4 [Onthophagus taurus]|uniref:CCN family member 4 n=1 Tax=Onthophagus taurus TaxID=166361 RepID=UPI000C2030D4|nr:WNT1-inducible-signaling pathway protein 1 [Onthophagus taurus]
MLWILIFATSLLEATGSSAIGKVRRRELDNQIYYESSERCAFPCTCPSPQEICDECLECPRQLGEPCSEDRPCDMQKGLTCKYLHGDTEGTCRESGGVPCIVYNRTYEHGETFSLDCRTQCACQNGTYGCSSLCPQEHISPKGSCRHPRLVDVPGQCCREWMCDGQAEQPPSCQPAFSKWSPCNNDCGGGLSVRRSNVNAKCEPETVTRICQIRRCDDELSPIIYRNTQHHLRRGHECKATHRLSSAVNFRFGPCKSRKRFRPKFCGLCPVPGIICEPILSTTVKVEFLCEGTQKSENVNELLPEYLEPGEDVWLDETPQKWWDSDYRLLTVSVQWVLKCRCGPIPADPTSSSGEVILHRVHRTAAP